MKRDIDNVFAEYKKQKKESVDKCLPLCGIYKARMLYPVTKILLMLLTAISGEKIVWLKKVRSIQTDKTIIFANTHRFKPDFEKITIMTKRPSFVIASDFKNAYKTISGWYFNTRPTIFIDPYSKEDKSITYEMMKRYLNAGMDCTIFPEAVWNLSENKPVLETFYGSVKAVLETNSVLVCTAIERYEKVYVLNRSDVINFSTIVKKYIDCSFGEIDKRNEESKEIIKNILKECNATMRDVMATLLWEIWEEDAKKNGVTKRKELADNYWEIFIDRLISEWPGYRIQDNIEQRYHNRFDTELELIKRDLANIHLSKQNAFLLDKRLKGRFVDWAKMSNNCL